ncbi:MAG TPA: IclR family transcriptional regulator [Desulfobacteraceae bacterium]|nr:IclR family transcriptional regulator [Desulfobacteraceae bacterium]HPQ28429.1 IclR family transcriptional regulator [Desulfobacteraceae bacterium]
MSLNYKRVPAIDKCFLILALMAEAKRPFGYNEIVRNLGLNKSTVFNILHTLNDLGVLEKGRDGLFRMGPRLFVLGNAAAAGSELIQTVHPYLETINREFKLSTFFGILSDQEVIILDKADRAYRIKISSEIGMRIPVFAGVAGKALLSQLPETEIDKILSQNTPKRYTPRTIIDKAVYKEEILRVKKTGIAYDREEYIEGLIAVAVPIQTHREDLQASLWTVGLKQEFREDGMMRIAKFLSTVVEEINYRFSMSAGLFGPKNEMLNA